MTAADRPTPATGSTPGDPQALAAQPSGPRAAPGGGRAEARARARAEAALNATGNLHAPIAAAVHPDWVTAAGVTAALTAAVAASRGRWRAAATLWALSCAADVADGVVARSRAETDGALDPRGAVTDSVADRICDAAIALGVAAAAAREGRNTTALAAVAASAFAPLPAHVSAKAAAVGFDPPRHAPGRLERCAAWTVALAVPRAAGPAAAWIAGGSAIATWRRWASLRRRPL